MADHDFSTTAVAAGLQTTLAGLIRQVAYQVGAVIEDGVPSAGSTTSLTDNITLANYADSTFVDKRLYVYDGPGLGQERRITAHAGATGVLTFPLGTAPTVLSKYIILDTPWQAGQIRAAIIETLRLHKRDYLEPMIDETLTISASPTITYGYNVPTDLAAIQQIWRENEVSGGLFTYPIPWDCWYINKAGTPQIVFEKEGNDIGAFLLHGAKLRLVGQKYETVPAADSDTVSVGVGAVVSFGAMLTLLGRVATDPTNARRYTAVSSMLLQEYQRSHRDDVQRVSPGSRLVDE